MGPDSFYCLVQYAEPGGQVRNIGVLLYDAAASRVLGRFVEDYGFIKDPEDREVVAEIGFDLVRQVSEAPDPLDIINHLEDSLSNVVLISERRPVLIAADAELQLGLLGKMLLATP